MFEEPACVHPRIRLMLHEVVGTFYNYWPDHSYLWIINSPTAIMKVNCATAPCPRELAGEPVVWRLGLAMHWYVYHGDLLDVPADVLVCSANVYLALSGGVGGAFLLRYGPAMQEALQQYLLQRVIRHVERGDVITMPPCGSPYRAVLHAVAVDGTYESSSAVVALVLAESLRQSAALGAQTVALAAVATGYGRMPMTDFAVAIRQVIRESFPPLERVTIGLRSSADTEELLALIPELKPAEPPASPVRPPD